MIDVLMFTMRSYGKGEKEKKEKLGKKLHPTLAYQAFSGGFS